MRFNLTIALWSTIILFNLYSLYFFVFIDVNQNHSTATNNEIEPNQPSTINKNECDYLNENIDEFRKQLFNDLTDLSFYLKSEFKKLETNHETIKNDKQFNLFKNNSNKRVNFILARLYNLSTASSLGEWRQRKHDELNNLVKRKLTDLQNPNECETKKKLICEMKSICGFGCQMHHLQYCLITAFSTNRTMYLKPGSWKYNKNGLEVYFKKLTTQCSISNYNITETWTNPLESNDLIIKIPIIDRIRNKKFPYLPPSIPNLFKERLTYHGNPLAWWSGQIISYLMTFNEKFEYEINKSEINSEVNCVGLHIRRTDKLNDEAFSYSLDMYMKHVDDYYDLVDLIKPLKQNKRVIYLATDDLSILNETQNFPNYRFYYNQESIQLAKLKNRYSSTSFENLIKDINQLSKCDYFVGTFSSQLGRLVYELMQVRHPDASWRYRSLDSVYHYGGQNVPFTRCILNHEPETEDEVELKFGDLIRYYPEKGLKKSSNLWNGYSFGRNVRTKKEGIFPTYKTKELAQSF